MKLKLLATVAALLLAATASASSAERVKFEMWHGLTGDLGGVVDQVCKRFNDSQSDYEIICTSQGSYDNALQNAIAAYRAKKNPTIVQIFDAGTLDLLLSEAYVPARKLMADNGYKINWEDYIPAISNYYANSKGELNSFPFNSSTAMMYWNKDAFAKIGKTEAPKTWEETFDSLKALKAAGYECPMAWNYDTWPIMEQFSAINNIPVATKGNGYQGLDAEFAVNKGKYVDIIKTLKKGYDDGLVKIKVPETGATIVQAFANGDCQVMLSSIADHGTVTKTQKPDMKWDVAMLPTLAGVERHNSLVGGASLWALQGKSDAEYKGAAAFFIFIAQPASALFWSPNTGYIPVTKSGFEFMKAQGFYDKAPYKGRELAIASLNASVVNENTRGIRLGGFVQIRKEMRDALTDIFANKVSVDDGINSAVERSNVVLRKFEKTYAGKMLP
jgi:sn-glycerol 3-phosphate transport system substrate-binding protein